MEQGRPFLPLSLRHVALLAACVLTVGAVLPMGTMSPPDDDAKNQDTYTSHYLVFGTRDAAGTPRLLALDFNRTERGDGRVDYEYKLFVARGGEWSMPVYETWTTDPAPEARRFPDRGGLSLTLTDEGHVRRARATLSDLSLEVTPKNLTFPFPTGEAAGGGMRTGHPQFAVQWNDTTYRGPGVYEWIRSTGASPSPEAAAEAKRSLDEEATFGLYDWIVLYDEEGRLWQISQGTLTSDFAYQQATEALPAETQDVLVRWRATERDTVAQQHSPTTWLVDVPAWQMRAKLRWTGEHRGHGPPQGDGTRPIYVQAGVEGRALIQGEQHRFFGMVEHIQD